MVEVSRKGFKPIIADNEEIFFSMIVGVTESVDEFAKIQITQVIEGVQFRISSSLPKYTPLLIEEVLKLHNHLGIHLDISKSIKSSSSIVFTINLK